MSIPAGPNTGALTEATPRSRSSWLCAQPRERIRWRPSPGSWSRAQARSTVPAEPRSSGSAAPISTIVRSSRIRLDRVDAHAPVAVADVELCALRGDARQAFERRSRELSERQLADRRRSEAEEPGAERVAEPADVEQDAVVFERVDQPMGGGAGDAGGLDDRGEGPRTALDGVDDREGSVEHADGRAWPGAPGRTVRHRRLPRVVGSLFRSSEPSSTIRNSRRRQRHRPLETGRYGATDDHPAAPLAEKVWDHHLVRRADGEPDLLYVDLHLVHEVTSPQAFDGLRLHGRPVRRPDLTVATMDHNVPTTDGPVTDEVSARQMDALRRNAEEFGDHALPVGRRRPGDRARDRAGDGLHAARA